MFENTSDIVWQKSVITDISVVSERVGENMHLHNSDIFDYKGVFEVELEAFHFEIIIIRRNTK
jgi:hypothetical protein